MGCVLTQWETEHESIHELLVSQFPSLKDYYLPVDGVNDIIQYPPEFLEDRIHQCHNLGHFTHVAYWLTHVSDLSPEQDEILCSCIDRFKDSGDINSQLWTIILQGIRGDFKSDYIPTLITRLNHSNIIPQIFLIYSNYNLFSKHPKFVENLAKINTWDYTDEDIMNLETWGISLLLEPFFYDIMFSFLSIQLAYKEYLDQYQISQSELIPQLNERSTHYLLVHNYVVKYITAKLNRGIAFIRNIQYKGIRISQEERYVKVQSVASDFMDNLEILLNLEMNISRKVYLCTFSLSILLTLVYYFQDFAFISQILSYTEDTIAKLLPIVRHHNFEYSEITIKLHNLVLLLTRSLLLQETYSIDKLKEMKDDFKDLIEKYIASEQVSAYRLSVFYFNMHFIQSIIIQHLPNTMRGEPVRSLIEYDDEGLSHLKNLPKNSFDVTIMEFGKLNMQFNQYLLEDQNPDLQKWITDGIKSQLDIKRYENLFPNYHIITLERYFLMTVILDQVTKDPLPLLDDVLLFLNKVMERIEEFNLDFEEILMFQMVLLSLKGKSVLPSLANWRMKFTSQETIQPLRPIAVIEIFTRGYLISRMSKQYELNEQELSELISDNIVSNHSFMTVTPYKVNYFPIFAEYVFPELLDTSINLEKPLFWLNTRTYLNIPRLEVSVDFDYEQLIISNLLLSIHSVLPFSIKVRSIACKLIDLLDGSEVDIDVKHTRELFLSTSTFGYKYPVEVNYNLQKKSVYRLQTKIETDYEPFYHEFNLFTIQQIKFREQKYMANYLKAIKELNISKKILPRIYETSELSRIEEILFKNDLNLIITNAHSYSSKLQGYYLYIDNVILISDALSEEQKESVIIHELMHVLQYLTNIGQTWIFPMILKARSSFRRETSIRAASCEVFREGSAQLIERLETNKMNDLKSGKTIYDKYAQKVEKLLLSEGVSIDTLNVLLWVIRKMNDLNSWGLISSL